MTSRLSKLSLPLVGAVALLVAVAYIAAVMTGVYRKPFEAGGRTVYADFQHAPQLLKGDQVRLDGEVDGRVADIEDLDGGGVRTKLVVEDDAGPIYRDARAHLRVKTLLAGSFYVDLERGRPSSGPLGDTTIPLSRTSVQVEIEDVTDAFRGDAIPGLRALPRELTAALRGPQAHETLLQSVHRNRASLQEGLTALRGQRPGADLPGVAANVERTVRALDTPTDDLTTLVAGAAATLETTAARGDDLSSIIRQAPPAASGLTRTLSRLETTLDTADGLVTRLDGAASDVAPTLAKLRPAVTSTGDLLTEAWPLLRHLRPAVRALGTTADDGVPLVDGIKPSLTRTDDKIIPGLAHKDERTGKSTSVMIGGFASGFGAIAAQQDQNGHLIRFPFFGTSTTVHLPCTSSVIDATAGGLLACESLEKAMTEYLSYFPLSQAPPKKAGR